MDMTTIELKKRQLEANKEAKSVEERLLICKIFSFCTIHALTFPLPCGSPVQITAYDWQVITSCFIAFRGMLSSSCDVMAHIFSGSHFHALSAYTIYGPSTWSGNVVSTLDDIGTIL